MSVMDRDVAVPAAAPEAVRRWAIAFLVAGAALLGGVILIALIALALQPPVWIQVLLGVMLAFGTAAFAWLVATALRSSGSASG